MKLYEYAELFNNAFNEMEALDDIPHEVIADTLEGIMAPMQDKALSVAAFILNTDAEIKAMDEAIARIKSRQESKKKRVEWLKSYLLGNLQAVGINRIESAELSVKIRDCPESVQIVNEDLIPVQFKREVIKTEIDKRAIKSAGGCPGADLVKNKTIVFK